jgi:hypothetical protein
MISYARETEGTNEHGREWRVKNWREIFARHDLIPLVLRARSRLGPHRAMHADIAYGKSFTSYTFCHVVQRTAFGISLFTFFIYLVVK